MKGWIFILELRRRKCLKLITKLKAQHFLKKCISPTNFNSTVFVDPIIVFIQICLGIHDILLTDKHKDLQADIVIQIQTPIVYDKVLGKISLEFCVGINAQLLLHQNFAHDVELGPYLSWLHLLGPPELKVNWM